MDAPSRDVPLVSIGMPLYNEARHLAQTLDALLAQELRDFEVIISDNASTDATTQICQAYAARDRRIRYVRQETNVGAVKNFNHVFELSRGRYFVWASGHDFWHPSYLSQCVALLEREPDVVLCYSQVVEIDQHGQPLGTTTDGLDTRRLDVFERFRAVMRGLAMLPCCDAIYGLIRADALRRTRLVRNIHAPDHLIVLELSLHGAIVQVPAPLYVRRVLPDRITDLETNTDRYLERLNPRNRRRRIRLDLSQMCAAYLGVAARGPFRVGQKMRLAWEIVWCFVATPKYRYSFLYRDLICGTLHLLFGESRAYYALQGCVYRWGKRVRAGLHL